MRLIAVQTDPVWLDPVENRRRVEAAIDAAGFAANDYLVLPEMCETAWTSDAGHLACLDGMKVGSVEWLCALARARKVWLQAGFGERLADGRRANSVAVVSPDGVAKAIYRKNFLFPSERSAFAAGEDLVLVDTGAAVVCPLICYDLRFPELWRLAALAGAECFAVSSSWPLARHEHWRALLVARAIENQAFVVACNRTGSDPANSYGGASALISHLGVRLAELGAEVAAAAGDFDRAAVGEWRARFGALRDVRASLLGSVRIGHA
ncbi:MAG: nitrilase-related carbon-nitrogen hydrolase [Planctomycetota bacterium]